MLIVKIEMWPGGDAARKYPVSNAAIWCVAQDADGKRNYRYLLCKDPQFGGPATDEELRAAVTTRQGWRAGTVSGHAPGDRGVWDLLGAVLVSALGARLRGYLGAQLPTWAQAASTEPQRQP